MKNPDDLNDLLPALRATPTSADPEAVSPGFETRVLARLHENARTNDATWFWRWSALFAAPAAVCAILVVQNLNALSDESLTALAGGGSLLSWFY